MGSKFNIAGMKITYKRILSISKGELTQAIGVISIAMWDSVSVKNFIVPVLHLQIGIENDVLNNLTNLIDSDVEKLSKGEEVACNAMVILNQVIVKIWQNHQIWDVHAGVMLQHKARQLKRIQATKESTPGLNYDI